MKLLTKQLWMDLVNTRIFVKNIFLKYIVFLFLLTLQLCAIGQVTVMQNANLDYLLKEGRKTEKRIMLLCCPEWCAPCKELENIYFKDKALADYLEKNYVIGKFDVEKKAGIPIAEKYGILQYPAVIVIDFNGLFYYKYVGITVDAASYLSSLRYYDSIFSKPVLGISNKLDLKFPDFYRKYFGERFKKLPDSNIVNSYLTDQKNIKTEVIWRILNLFDYSSKYDQDILDNFKEFSSLYGIEAHQKVNGIIEKSLKNSLASRNKEEYLRIVKFMEVNSFPEQRVLEAKIKYHLLFQELSPNFGSLLKGYFKNYDNSLSVLCDSLFFKKNIEFIDEIMIEKLINMNSIGANSIWNLYLGLFTEKKEGLQSALPHYVSYLQLVVGDKKKYEKFIVLRDKLLGN